MIIKKISLKRSNFLVSALKNFKPESSHAHNPSTTIKYDFSFIIISTVTGFSIFGYSAVRLVGECALHLIGVGYTGVGRAMPIEPRH